MDSSLVLGMNLNKSKKFWELGKIENFSELSQAARSKFNS
jgi:hypothetical protein